MILKMHSNRPCIHCGLPSSAHRPGTQRCISGGPPRYYRAAFGSAIDAAKLKMPDLGDASLSWPALLTEPEINNIYAAVGFLEAACQAPIPKVQRWWLHYGPTLMNLVDRLFDDAKGRNATAPVRSPKPKGPA